MEEKHLCEYGCGREGKYYFPTVKKWCCSETFHKCSCIVEKNRKRNIDRKHTEETRKKMKEVIRNPKKKSIKLKNSKKLCYYGCGNEAKFLFNNGKHCCSKNQSGCPVIKNKLSERSKNAWKDPNSLLNSEEYRNILSKLNKKLWKDPNSVFNSETFRRKMSDAQKGKKRSEEWKINHSRKLKGRIQWSKGKTGVFSEDTLEKMGLSKRMTFDELRKRYSIFFEFEEVKRTEEPTKFKVRCKNKNCSNSKENNGWFIVSYKDICERIRSLKSGRNKQYLFCSKKCKDESPYFRCKYDPLELQNLIQYRREVNRQTCRTMRLHPEKITNLELRSNNYHIDHKYSIYYGFKNKVHPRIMSHWKNLEILKREENSSKFSNCSISLEDLKEEISLIEGNNFVEKYSHYEVRK